MRTVYLIWFILPLILFLMSAWAVWKKALKMKGKEHVSDYFPQAIFCVLVFIVAVLIDSWLTQPFIEENIQQIEASWISEDQLMVVSWLSYPALLLLFSWIQSWLRPEKTNLSHKF